MNTYIREPINALTHFFGAIFAFVGLLAMVIKVSSGTAGPLQLNSIIIFGVSMILLYSASTIYHTAITKRQIIAFLRKIDHSMIFVLIAGTYTPFCLISLEGWIGWTLFSIIWGLAILGIIFKMVWFRAPRWLSTGIYIGMGWLVIFFIYPLSKVIEPVGLLLLLIGGIFYTIGGVIYGLKPKFLTFKHLGFHEIFHVFILLGSTAHFLAVYLYVI